MHLVLKAVRLAEQFAAFGSERHQWKRSLDGSASSFESHFGLGWESWHLLGVVAGTGQACPCTAPC